MVKKKRVVLRFVNEIPRELVTEFIRNTMGAGAEQYHKVESAEVKIGAFCEKAMIGFMAGKLSEISGGSLWIQAPYVRAEFHGRRIGSRMLVRMFSEARNRGIHRVAIENTTLKFDVMGGRAMGILKRRAPGLVRHEYRPEETGEWWWDFSLRKPPTPRKRPRPR